MKGLNYLWAVMIAMALPDAGAAQSASASMPDRAATGSFKLCNADAEYRQTQSALRKAGDLIGKGRQAEAENLLDASTRKLVAYETSRKLYLQHPPGAPDLDDSGLRLAYAEGAARKSGGAGPVDLKMSMLKNNLQTLCDELIYRSGHR